MSEPTDEILNHFGVRGMRWGVRHADNPPAAEEPKRQLSSWEVAHMLLEKPDALLYFDFEQYDESYYKPVTEVVEFDMPTIEKRGVVFQ